MAIFRKVHTQIWSDPFFSELDSDKKIFYLYLLTNERTKQCGIYEISKRHIAFDLHISTDKVNKLIEYFSSIGKIRFSEATNELALKNWAKYNYSTSPKVVKCIESELKLVKNRVLIEYIYSMDTLSQEEEEQEEEQEEDVKEEKSKKVDVKGFIEWFNNMKLKYDGSIGKFKGISDRDKNNLHKLKNLKYDSTEWEHAFKMMCKSQWVKDNKMVIPSHFLANDNFQRYLNQVDTTDKIDFAWNR
jgi:hypothetical protein